MLSRHGSWRHLGRDATAALVAFLVSNARPSAAGTLDWPQFLGPERNGVYRGPALAKSWPAAGPAVVWNRPVGQGVSGPVISGGRLVLHHRVGAKTVVECLDARTGRELWQAGHPTDYRDDFGFDEGPRATPAIAGGRVFTFGAEGRLSCWSLTDGAAVWSVDTQRELGSPKGFFGRACSPLVESNLVVLNVGGRGGTGIVAFDAATGSRRWQATDDEASYASPVAASIRGQRVILSLTREALVALKPTDGRVLFRYRFRPAPNASVSAATPLVVEDLIFISAS